MWSYSVVSDARPPKWRSALLALATGILSLYTVVCSPSSYEVSQPNPGSLVVVHLLAALICVVLGPAALFWRHRWPFKLPIIFAAVALVVPIGPSLAWVAMASLLSRRRGPAVWWVVAGVSVSTLVVTILDGLATPRGASVLKTIFGPVDSTAAPDLTLPWWAIALAAVVPTAIAVGAGLLLRWRREVKVTDAKRAQAEAETISLGDEVARRQERERISREVHDALGHRLSLVNLHAGALEANAGDNERLASSARLVRESAGEAMDELRSLLAVLRDPMAEQPAIPLSKLREVVQKSFGAGQRLNSSIFIADADAAPPAVTRAVYRIVQELLNNAAKHAAGEPVALLVEGRPGEGIVIEASNPAPKAKPPTAVGGGRGLRGLAERAELLGGRVQYGLDGEGQFRVRVQLPWPAKGAGARP